MPVSMHKRLLECQCQQTGCVEDSWKEPQSPHVYQCFEGFCGDSGLMVMWSLVLHSIKFKILGTATGVCLVT